MKGDLSVSTTTAGKPATRRGPLLTAANARKAITVIQLLLLGLLLFNPFPFHVSVRGAIIASTMNRTSTATDPVAISSTAGATAQPSARPARPNDRSQI